MAKNEWDDDVTEPNLPCALLSTDIPPPPPTERDLYPITEPVDAPDMLPELPEIPNDSRHGRLPAGLVACAWRSYR